MAKAAEKLSFPADLVKGVPRLVMNGYRELTIGNYSELLEFGTQKVSVIYNGCVLSVEGDEMEIKNLRSDEMILSGTIFKIELKF